MPRGNLSGTLPDAQLSANVALLNAHIGSLAAGCPLSAAGVIVHVVMTSGGSGCVTSPAVTVADSTRKGAEETAVISGAQVTGFIVVSGLSGYDAITSHLIVALPTTA